MSFKHYREQSRNGHWGSHNETLTIEQINCGSLLRIADALEAMVRPYKDLLQETKDLRDSREYWRSEHAGKTRSMAALKANYTRLKRKGGAS